MDPSTSLWLFISLFLFRYTKLIVGILTYIFYNAVPVSEKPLYGPGDATVIIPTTFREPHKLIITLLNIQHCHPAKTIIVTAEAHVVELEVLCKLNLIKNYQVFSVEKLGKRRQLIRALPHVETDIVVLADDDVIWPTGCLTQLLAVFEDDKVGAGGPAQRVVRASGLGLVNGLWIFLGICYLERRVWNNITTQAIDGSISTLSGRTAAYRTALLQNEQFYDYFLNDYWLGHKLDSDDDKSLTRHVFRNGYKIKLQRSTTIETTMETNSNYLEQCKRWARAHWRGNFIVMMTETYWISFRHLWGLYAIYLSQFLTPTLVFDGLLLKLMAEALTDDNLRRLKLWLLLIWIIGAKLVRLVPHFCRYPQDMIYIPVVILFGWFHGLLNVFALTTLTVTRWGSQPISELEKADATAEVVVPLLIRENSSGELAMIAHKVE